MLLDEKIAGLQVDVIAIPDNNYFIYGDDIVVLFENGNKHFIQAKVNQSNHQYWKLTDSILQKELISARNQLLVDPYCEFYFYSRTPFSTLQRVIEEAILYTDYSAFLRVAPQNQKDFLERLSELWEIEQPAAFDLVKRIGIGAHHSSEDWQKHSLSFLQANFSRPKTALEIIFNFVDQQHSKLGSPNFVIGRIEILEVLEKHGIYHVLGFNEQKLIEKFKTFSLQGRQWVRTIGGQTIIRVELELLKRAIQKDVSTVLLEDVAGGGKTCILLDLIDYLDKQDGIVTLFIKGDLFASIDSLNDLAEFGLPQDFISQSAYIAEKRRLVIIIDSLDVLAVGRSHKSLQCFLGLIANLSEIPNITFIAASRSFDIKYDPLLRETSWNEIITVKPLSFNGDVAPLLIEWGIDPDEICAQLQNLLLIPQNLRLFYVLIQKGLSISEIEEHDLYDSYVREIVEKDEHLGSGVVDEIQNVANSLLTLRSYYFPKNSIKVSALQLQRLLSQEILAEVSPHQLMFSHQTLADALRIRQAQINYVTLQQFVTSQPQLPFIRPAVRSFILSLRSVQPDQFAKQMRQFLVDDNISIHLKRLAVETLAEMDVREEDLAIILMIESRLPSIFSRFLDRANGEGWFLLLYNNWLAKISKADIKNSAGNVLRYFSQFLHGHEEYLISVWNRAFDEQWLPISDLAWVISSDLKNLNRWDTPGAIQILEKILDANDGGRNDVGLAICQYIEATGDGDELLWRYIIRDAKPIKDIRRGQELKLNCEKHNLLNEKYLEKRLISSDILFRIALEYILEFSRNIMHKEHDYPFESELLDFTSYNRRHTISDIRPHESIHQFLYAFETAMKSRAKNNDPLWKEYEPRFRVSLELGIRYLACTAYLSNTAEHIEGITYQLTDRDLLWHRPLDYEIGLLVKKSYPLIPYEIQEKHQRLIIALCNEQKSENDNIEHRTYENLSWIPVIYRLSEMNDFFRNCEKKYGKIQPEPSIRSFGGFVKSPVSTEKLTELSHISLIKILHYFNEYNERQTGVEERLIGGRDSLESALSAAASWVPMHFVPLVTMIGNSDLSISYIHTIIDGLALHLRCRFGNLSSSNWKTVEPLPDGRMLAKTLLDFVERFCDNDKRGYTTSRAIEACSEVLDDDRSIERICFQLWRLGLNNNPEMNRDDEVRSLIDSGINSPRGVAAESLLIICNDRLEKGKTITEELKQLLIRYAKDPSMVVRASFLQRFPYFLSQKPELGWILIELLVQNSTPRLYKHLEQTLYYQYYLSFDAVKSYLDLLKTCDDKKSAVAWGRLATLSFLSDHLSEEELWQGVYKRHEATKEGMGQVFVANINSSKTSADCIRGLSRLMEKDAPKSIFLEVERSLENKDQSKFVPVSLIKLFVANTPAEHIRDVDGAFYWLEQNVMTMPNDVLEILENLVARLSGLKGPFYFHKPDALISTLKMLLQEADLSDNIEFIDKVLSVQDWFLDHGVKELESLLEAT